MTRRLAAALAVLFAAVAAECIAILNIFEELDRHKGARR